MSTVAAAVPAQFPSRPLLPVAFIGALLGLSFLPRIAAVPALALSFWGACALLAAWYLVLLVRARGQRSFGIEIQIIRVHWVQMCMHSTIYVYWGWIWPFIYGQVPLVIGQVLFAYAFGMLQSWTRGDRYRLGFGPVPIIGSTNLFLTFKDEWFYLQFALVALGIAAKEFIRWQRDGHSAHIFNPSSFPLFVVSLLLIATHATHLSWGNEISANLDLPAYMFYCLFVLGLIVQSLFRVTLVTLGSALALYVLGVLYTAATGVYWFLDAGIPIAVFLGMHLLVTDPATSPRTDTGRFMFGIGYGAGVFALYGLLEWLHVPSFYDKLLCVPILNLTVRAIDRTVNRATWLETVVPARLRALGPGRRNLLYIGLWSVLFAWMAGTHFIGSDFPGLASGFWDTACAEGRHDACRIVAKIRAEDCNDGKAEACVALAPALLNGRLPSTDALEPVRVLARACDLGRKDSCVELARVLGPEQRAALTSACAAKDSSSCYILGSSALFGIATPADRGVAFGYFRQSCDLGAASGCSVMADMYRFGVGVPKDAQRALAGHDRACSLAFAPSCVTLADMLAQGEGTARDARRADEMRRRACREGIAASCRH